MKLLLSIPVLVIAILIFSGCSVNKKDGEQTKENLTIKTDVCFYQTYNIDELDIYKIQTELQNAVDIKIHYYNHSCPAILSTQNKEDIQKITEAFSSIIERDILPKDFHYLWNYYKELNVYDMIALKGEPAIRNGISKIDIGFDRGYYLEVQFDNATTKLWEDVTSDNIGRAIAIVVDNKVLSYPMVRTSIIGGKVQIVGNFSKR